MSDTSSSSSGPESDASGSPSPAVYFDLMVYFNDAYRNINGALDRVLDVDREYELMDKVAERSTTPAFDQLLNLAPRQPEGNARDEIMDLTLGECEKTGLIHGYSENRCCVKCRSQHCKDCDGCLVRECIRHDNIADAEAAGLERKDMLAAKRISARCTEHMTDDTEEDRCNCSQYIIKPLHSCPTGQYHLCKPCLDVVILPKCKIVNTINVGPTTGQGSIQTKECKCGRSGCNKPADPTAILECIICRGVCHRFTLNGKLSGGAEANDTISTGVPHPEQNKGYCPYFLL